MHAKKEQTFFCLLCLPLYEYLNESPAQHNKTAMQADIKSDHHRF